VTWRGLRPFQHPDTIAIDLQRPPRGDARVELAQGAGGGVARIDEGLLALRPCLIVEAPEAFMTDEHLAAHLQPARRIALQAQGHGGDGAHIDADVLARGAVAAGGAAHQRAILVEQAYRQAIELRLRRVLHLLDLQPLAHAAVKVGQLLVAEGIVQGQHGQFMLHGAEGLEGFGTDPLGGGIGGDGVGMARLQLLQFAQQAVIFGIADLGTVEDVIEIVVTVQLGTQLIDALEIPGLAHGLWCRVTPWRAVRAACARTPAPRHAGARCAGG
jgi:hypothetical protein